MVTYAYEKEADVKKHFYFVNFSDMASVNYRFAGTHIHRSIELVFCYGGTLKANINKNEILINKNDVLIVNPFDWHYYEYVENASCFILVISKEYFDDLIDEEEKEFNNKISLDDETAHKIYALCLETEKNLDLLSYIAKKTFVLNVFHLLEPFTLFRKKQFVEDKNACRKIIAYVSEHCTEKLSIGRVAAALGYSRNYFSSLFNRLVGENFNTFVNRYRVEKVKEMKKNHPEMSIEEMIYAAGFSSRETFYRFVRKIEKEGM